MRTRRAWQMIWLGWGLFVLTGCSSLGQPVVPTPLASGKAPTATVSSVGIALVTQDQVTITAPAQPTLIIAQQTQIPLVCPSVPVYPAATRIQYERSRSSVRRIAFYTTRDSPAQIFRWFQENRRAPEWSWDGEGEDWVRYTNRGADDYNPAISLLIGIDGVQAGLTTFRVRLTIGHPHINGDWCPSLEP
jgi:hypothetical protein